MTGGGWQLTLRQAWTRGGGRAGLIGIGALAVIVAFLPFLLPDYRVQSFPPLLAPQLGHPLGTDSLGRDLLSRVVWGGRISLTIAIISVALAMTLGASVGLVAGYLGGAIDSILMRFVDGAMAIPRLFILLLVVAVLDRVPFLALILVLGTTGWFSTSRIVRAEVLRLREEAFVLASEALGAGPWRVISRHLLPNAAGPLLVAATLAVGDVILLEAGLSFLGYGVQPPRPSWGGLIFDAKPYLGTAPWLGLFPGLAIVLTVLSVSLVSDALRDAIDPRSA